MENRLSISSVLSGTFSAIGSNPLATLGIAFLIGVLPTQILSYVLTGGTAASRLQLFSSAGGITLYFAILLFSIFCAMLVQATLVRVTVAHARDEKVSIGTSLAASMAKVVPLFALTILMIVALIPATMALFIPGIILYIMWSVATPAIVAEDVGIFEAFGRSRALTKGHRWKIFGLFLVIAVIMWIILAVVGVLLFTTGLAAGAAANLSGGALPIGFLVINAIASTLVTALSGTLIANLYVQLRMAQDGPMTDMLAEVFA